MRYGVNTWDKLTGQGERILYAYIEDMKQRGLSASTIHSYIAAPCKALGIHLQEIEKPKRIAAKGVRASGGESQRSAKEKHSPAYRDVYRFISATGIRESEARRLTGECIGRDECGRLYVWVRSGKGGKMQRQRILPENEWIVLSAFAGKAPGERIFRPDQFSEHINYQLARAKNAQRSYYFYLENYQTKEARTDLAIDLLKEYRSALDRALVSGKIRSEKKLEKQAAKFAREVIDDRDKPYILIGDNRKLAESKGMPVSYDRLALMAVSVFHLSHWRLGVTVSNYMLK